jgi:hypothetical protein
MTEKIETADATKLDDRIELFTINASGGTTAVELHVGDATIHVDVKKRLTLFERSKMAEEIADYCFVSEFYTPYMRDFAERISVLSFYTDINVDELTMETAYALTQNSELFAAVYHSIDDDIDGIFEDAYALIEWRKEQMLHSAKADELYDAIKQFVNGLEAMLDGIAESIGDTSSLPGFMDAIQKIAGKDAKELARGVLDFQETQAKQSKKPVRKN